MDYGLFIVRPNQEYVQNRIKTKQFGFQTRYGEEIPKSQVEMELHKQYQHV